MSERGADTGRPAHAAAVGIDVGGTNLRAAYVDASGAVGAQRRLPTPPGAEDLMASIAELIAGFAPDLPVGIGIAGLVTPEGMVRYSPNLGVQDLDVAGRMAAQTGRSVSVVNDASAAALGEARYGAGDGVGDLLLITVGTGIGGGLVADHRLVTGAGGLAGEVGHVRVERAGRACACGARGCLEAYASAPAVATAARQGGVVPGGREAPTASDVAALAAAGEGRARAVIEHAGDHLGEVVAMLVTVLDPAVVVLGGGAGVVLAPWYGPAIERRMAATVFAPGFRTLPEVRTASLGDDAGVVGAALVAATERSEESA